MRGISAFATASGGTRYRVRIRRGLAQFNGRFDSLEEAICYRDAILAAHPTLHLRGEETRFWKGGVKRDEPHNWLKRHYTKTGTCEHCGDARGSFVDSLGVTRSGTDWAFLHHPEPHTRNRADYAELCRSCHMRMDATNRAFDPKLTSVGRE